MKLPFFPWPERQKKGVALIAALMAAGILTALGISAFTVSTQDVRISSRTLGERKALLAAEREALTG